MVGATDRSAASRESCRLVTAAPQGDKREPSRVCHGEGHGRRHRAWSAAPRNPPGYGEWNGRRVGAGTGEALPGPSVRSRGAGRRITGEPREVAGSREGGGAGRSSDRGRGTTQPRPMPRARASPMLARRDGAHECQQARLTTCAGIAPRTANRPGMAIWSVPSSASSTVRPSSAQAAGSTRCSTRSTARTCYGQRGSRSPATVGRPGWMGSASGRRATGRACLPRRAAS
jgi:hypothetical protein